MNRTGVGLMSGEFVSLLINTIVLTRHPELKSYIVEIDDMVYESHTNRVLSCRVWIYDVDNEIYKEVYNVVLVYDAGGRLCNFRLKCLDKTEKELKKKPRAEEGGVF